MKWYQFDIRNLSNDEYQKWYSLMNEERKTYVDRFRRLADKKRSVAGEMLARRAIAEWCGVSAESICFGRKGHGKPFAIDLSVDFNISHSGNTVVCAVSDTSVGIDVEEIRPIDLSIAEHICTEEDLEYLFGRNLADNDIAKVNDQNLLIHLLKIWTAKEAYFKCLGTGITDLKNISYTFIRKEPQFLQFIQNQAVIAIFSETAVLWEHSINSLDIDN